MANGIGFFQQFSRGIARAAGRPATFALVVAVVLAWAVSGPVFAFSEAWQLTINTLTTIVTFLMVFLIQSTQNRDSEAIQLKLDEIILALDSARNELLDSENLSEEEQLRLHRKYLRMAEQARSRIRDEVSDIEERREKRTRS